MSVPTREKVVATVQDRFNCTLSLIEQKRIMYRGKTSESKTITLCTPETKIHDKEHGWFDLTTKRVEILDEADIAIMAVRVENGKVYFIEFKNLRRLMTKDMIIEYGRDAKWRFYIWEDHIQLFGVKEKFYVSGEWIK